MRTIAGLLLLVGCATEHLSTTVSAVSDPPKEQTLCDPNVCFIHRCRDSDGDAICDADENVLETDPENRNSRPDFRGLLTKLRELPSFQEGQSMLVVLPTVGPDGQAVFGGDVMLPTRHSLLKEIGIELPDGALDLTDGLMLVRSLESANAVEYHRPPWTMPEMPAPDTTRDSGATESMGGALKGLEISNLVFQNSSTDGAYSFAEFSFTDQMGGAWTVSTQSGPTYTHTKAETHQKNALDMYEFDKTVDVETTVDENGNTYTTTTTTTHYQSSDGKQKSNKVTMTSVAKSADGRQQYHEQADENGNRFSKTCFDGECFSTKPVKLDEAGDFPAPADDGTAVAYSDPDYFEYVASPEVIDSILVVKGGPVRVVNPLTDAADETFVPGLDNHHMGPVSLYAPDAASTSSSEPLFIHLPFGGDYDPNAEEAPSGDQTYQGGQCLYCYPAGD